MTIYLSGPMRGIEDDNRPAFDAAALLLDNLGHQVISPADLDRAVGIVPGQTLTKKELAGCLCADVMAISQSDVVLQLDGADESVGCRIESLVAAAMGVEVMGLADFLAFQHGDVDPPDDERGLADDSNIDYARERMWDNDQS